MENRDSQSPSQTLPEVFSVENIPENLKPTPEDWKLLQGGMPEVVSVRPGLFNIIHRYVNSKDPVGTGTVIPTSVPIVENWRNKTITKILSNGRKVIFPTALLWEYHRKGCESRSRTRYERVKVKSDNSK